MQMTADTGADDEAGLPVLPPRRPPLVPERSDFLDGDDPAADKVAAFSTRALEASGIAAAQAAAALAGPLDRGRPQRSSGRS
jgi:hypothetical protein